jgi:hypothetical protein
MDICGTAACGIQKAQDQLDTVAKRVAQVGRPVEPGAAREDTVELSKEILKAIEAKHIAGINALVLKAEAEMHKPLIDILA